MKLSAGVIFMVAALLIGLAALAGGQAWMLSGSLPLAGLTATVVIAGLIAAGRLFLRRAGASIRVRFLGEAAGGLDEADFVEVADEAEAARLEIERGVRQRPERVASSIRTLLVKGKSRES